MIPRLVTFVTIGLASLGCGSSDSGINPPGTTPPDGHALHLTATLKQQGGELSFMTPSGVIVKQTPANVVGKPYMIASFPAGFSPGNDPAIHSTWNTVPADLTIRYATPSTYKDGAYDMVLVVYLATPITDAIKAAPVQEAPPAKGGDLATFTADMTPVRAGDPSIPPGLVRLNVEGADAEVSVDNKVVVDPAQIGAALTNTIMLVP